MEPKDQSHKSELVSVKSAITSLEELNSLLMESKFEKAEEVAKQILDKCTEFTTVKLNYLECLIKSMKFAEIYRFYQNNRNEDEKENPEFDYIFGLAFYYEGK